MASILALQTYGNTGNLRDGTIGCMPGAEAMLFGEREQSCWEVLAVSVSGLVPVAIGTGRVAGHCRILQLGSPSIPVVLVLLVYT